MIRRWLRARRDRRAARVLACLRAEPGRRWYVYGDLAAAARVRPAECHAVLAELQRANLVERGWEPTRWPDIPERRQYWLADPAPEASAVTGQGQPTTIRFPGRQLAIRVYPDGYGAVLQETGGSISVLVDRAQPAETGSGRVVPQRVWTRVW